MTVSAPLLIGRSAGQKRCWRGILAVVPGQAAIAVWSPELDNFGSSVVGTAALEYFAN